MRLHGKAGELRCALREACERAFVEIAPHAERYGARAADVPGDAFRGEGVWAVEPERAGEAGDLAIGRGDGVRESTVRQERGKVADDVAPGARFGEHTAFGVKDAPADAGLSHPARRLLVEVLLELRDILHLHAVQRAGQFGESEQEYRSEREDGPDGDPHGASSRRSSPMRRRARCTSANAAGARITAMASAPARAQTVQSPAPHRAVHSW